METKINTVNNGLEILNQYVYLAIELKLTSEDDVKKIEDTIFSEKFVFMSNDPRSYIRFKKSDLVDAGILDDKYTYE